MKPRAVQTALVKVIITQPGDQSTVRVEIRSHNRDVPLGEIAWDTNWKQYAFTPAQGARYTVKVLRAISRQLDICMRAWERQKGKGNASQ